MLRLIADLNLNSERGRQGGQERQRRGDTASGGGGTMGTVSQRNLFVKNAPLIQEEVLKSAETVKMVVSRGGEQHTPTHSLPQPFFRDAFSLFLQDHLFCGGTYTTKTFQKACAVWAKNGSHSRDNINQE